MRPALRHVLHACGWISLGLGAIGLVLPVLPTVPFVLLAAALFLRSSERSHAWLVTHPRFGRHVRDYLDGRGVRGQTKAIALAWLWTTVMVSVVFFVALPLGDALLVMMALAVTVHILRLPTCREDSGD